MRLCEREHERQERGRAGARARRDQALHRAGARRWGIHTGPSNLHAGSGGVATRIPASFCMATCRAREGARGAAPPLQEKEAGLKSGGAANARGVGERRGSTPLAFLDQLGMLAVLVHSRAGHAETTAGRGGGASLGVRVLFAKGKLRPGVCWGTLRCPQSGWHPPGSGPAQGLQGKGRPHAQLATAQRSGGASYPPAQGWCGPKMESRKGEDFRPAWSSHVCQAKSWGEQTAPGNPDPPPPRWTPHCGFSRSEFKFSRLSRKPCRDLQRRPPHLPPWLSCISIFIAALALRERHASRWKGRAHRVLGRRGQD